MSSNQNAAAGELMPRNHGEESAQLSAQMVGLDRLLGPAPTNLSEARTAALSGIQKAAVGCLEVGRALLFARHLLPAPEFAEWLDGVGIGRSSAAQYMKVAVTYSRTDERQTLAGTLSYSKLLEIAREDDEVIDALARGESIGAITLDEVDRMGTRELRAALRKARGEAESEKAATERIIADKEATIRKLAKLDASKSPDDRWQQATADIGKQLQSTVNELLKLRGMIVQVVDGCQDSTSLRLTCGSALAVLASDLVALADEFPFQIPTDGPELERLAHELRRYGVEVAGTGQQ